MTEVYTIRPVAPKDRDWIRAFLTDRWQSVVIISRGRIYSGDLLLGFIAWIDESPAGLITYHFESDQCEIVTIDSLTPGIGIGGALIARVRQEALAHGCRRLWLITTNDNLPALRFYQQRGFQLVAIYPNAIAVSRKLKPSIPLTGIDDIPIRDEIELEVRLS